MAKRKIHTPEQIRSFLDELKTQTDRGVAILAAAVLEDLLEIVIQKRLVELSSARRDALFGRMAPLSTFSAKIEFGFAIGLYNDRLRMPLDMIRDVRNKFAHRMEKLSFDDPAIAALVRKVRTERIQPNTSTRDAFLAAFSAASILLYLYTAAEDIRIKLLGETHQSLFVDFAFVLRELQDQWARDKAHSPQTPESERTKP